MMAKRVCESCGARGSFSAGFGATTILVVLAVLTVCVTLRSANAEERLTRVSLEDVLQLALRENPTLQAKEDEHRSVKANEITASLRQNPTAVYTAEQIGARGTITEHTITIRQPIELAGKRQRRIASAEAATVVTGFQLTDVRRQMVLQIKAAFVNALVAREQLTLAQASLRTLDETARLQRGRFEKGDLARLELTPIEVQRFTIERDAADARQAIETAKMALRTAAGSETISADFDLVGALTFQPLSLGRDELIRLALANRPDLMAAEAERGRARADHDLARANAWWDITPQIGYQRIGRENAVTLGISVPLPIFDRNQGEITRSRSEINRVNALARAARLQVLSDVTNDVSAAITQRDRVVAFRDTHVPRMQRARDDAEDAYRRGDTNLTDFLEAQRVYREVVVQHLQALGAYTTAIYQLEADIGRPLAE